MPYAAENASEQILTHFTNTEMTAGMEGTEWEIIVKYNGDIALLEKDFGLSVEILSENYAILTIDQSMLQNLYQYSEIEYIEFPKALTANIAENVNSACLLTAADMRDSALTGSGVLIAVIDSGIDYLHPDFINDDNTSRILAIWDQTAKGTPPQGFKIGAEYTREQIDKAIAAKPAYSLIPQIDYAGHGTAIAGIAAGNGRGRGGAETGIAPEASILAVKLGREGGSQSVWSTELMRAIKYAVDMAIRHKMPLVINLSYGSNNGTHDGHSLFEEYINQMAQKWKTSIVIASGNEGSAGHHFAAKLNQGETLTIEFSVAENLKSMYLTLWKNSVDEFTLELISPNGTSINKLSFRQPYSLIHMESTMVIVSYQQSTQYNVDNEVFMQFQRNGASIVPGVWQLLVTGRSIVDGRFDIWLPTLEEVSARTAFMRPDPGTSLTLPSCTLNAITVGAYNASLDSLASFSGRGYTRNDVYVKPDLVAPGVNVVSPRAGGGYDAFTGTSVAASFVTGAAAALMQWGIVNGNDPFLYGQRLKSILRKGANRSKDAQYPNPMWGYGSLCLKQSLEFIKKAGG